MDNLLQIKNITAQVEEKVIIDNVSLSVDSGEILAIMGPNGSGKSSLAQIIMGNSSYEVSSGEILLEGRNIIELSPDERSKLGIFLAFQYPVEIPGVPLFAFLKLMYETHKNEKLSVFRFRQILKEKMKFLGIDEKFISRNLNEGFSGGEKKKIEILQMLLIDPKLVILDETDSGLDVDALKSVFTALAEVKKQNSKLSIIIISHYSRVFDYLTPDHVVILGHGQIMKQGGVEIIDSIEKDGYM